LLFKPVAAELPQEMWMDLGSSFLGGHTNETMPLKAWVAVPTTSLVIQSEFIETIQEPVLKVKLLVLAVRAFDQPVCLDRSDALDKNIEMIFPAVHAVF